MVEAVRLSHRRADSILINRRPRGDVAVFLEARVGEDTGLDRQLELDQSLALINKTVRRELDVRGVVGASLLFGREVCMVVSWVGLLLAHLVGVLWISR